MTAATAPLAPHRSRWATGSRIASSAALVVLLIGAIWLQPAWVTTTLVVLVAALAGGEAARLFNAAGAAVPTGFVALAAALASIAVSGVAGPASDALQVLLLALLMAAGAVTLAIGPPSPAVLMRASSLVMAPIYVGVPLGLFSWMRETSGPAAITWVVAVVAISDSAQYFAGRAFGRTKLAPLVSPAKTREGAIGGLVAVLLFGALTGPRALGTSVPSGAALALVLAGAGIIGDLFESLLKRSAGVKDSSHLIPGHGGVLDRIDSHLFAAPAYFFFQRFFG